MQGLFLIHRLGAFGFALALFALSGCSSGADSDDSGLASGGMSSSDDGEKAPGSGSSSGTGGEAPGGDGETASGGAQATGGNGGEGGAQATGGGSGGNSGGNNGGGTATFTGTIQISRFLGTSQSRSAIVSFSWIKEQEPAASRCTSTQHGLCRVSSCPPAEPAAPDTPAEMRPNAGAITIKSDDPEAPLAVTLTPKDNSYSTDEWTGDLLGGELLTISAEGDSVPGFVTTVRFPLAPLLMSPAVSSEATGVVPLPTPRDQDLEFTLDLRETATTVVAAGQHLGSDGSQTSLYCTFSGSGGIPASALAQLPATTKIRLYSTNVQNVELEGGRVTVRTVFEMASESKRAYPHFELE